MPSTATIPTPSCIRTTSLKFYATLRSSFCLRRSKRSRILRREATGERTKSRNRKKLRRPPRRLLKRRRKTSNSLWKRTP